MQISSGIYQSNKVTPKRNISWGANHSVPTSTLTFFEKLDLPCAYCGEQMLQDTHVCEHNGATKKGQDAILWLQSLLPFTNEEGKEYIERFCLALRQDNCQSLTLRELTKRISKSVKKNLLHYIYTQCKIPDKPSHELKKLLNFISNTLKSDSSAKQCLKTIKKTLNTPYESHIEKEFLEQAKKIINELDLLSYHYLPLRTRSVEHILPHSEGGDDELSNLLSVCNKCNCKRDNKDFKTFAETNHEIIPNVTRQLELIDEMLSKTDEETQNTIAEYLEGVCHTLETQLGHPLETDLPFLKERMSNDNMIMPDVTDESAVKQ